MASCSGKHLVRLSLKSSSILKAAVPQCTLSLRSAHTDSSDSKSVNQYYNELIDDAKMVPSTSSSSESLPKTDKEERIQKARVIFGSRLAGPAERRRELDGASTRIAGILVPPRPEEPDNCCMSGCVNCVWDRYRDELEEWAMKSAEAREALTSQRSTENKTRERSGGPQAKILDAEMPSHVASSMDDDGGGSESLWTGNDDGSLLDTGRSSGDDLFKDIPVGIREFMRTEKRLKDKKARKAAMGS